MQRPGFDTVLHLINLMIQDMLDPEDAPPPPPAPGASLSGSGAVTSGGAAVAGNGAAGRRDNSHFFQDL
jgi:hypothetical protein